MSKNNGQVVPLNGHNETALEFLVDSRVAAKHVGKVGANKTMTNQRERRIANQLAKPINFTSDDGS